MVRFRPNPLLLTLLLITGCDRAPNMPELGEEVQRFLGSYVTTIEARDTAALRTYLTDDRLRFVWYEDGEARYRTPAQVLKAVAELPSDAPPRTRLTGTTVLPLDSWTVWAAARFETSVGSGESAYSFGGVMTVVLEREDGRWKILTGHTSTRRTRTDSTVNGGAD